MSLLERMWPTDEARAEVIKSTAESLHESVFLAVHQPVTFVKRAEGGDESDASENELLSAFMAPNLPDGRLILPIVGSSGVGKTHVIRWLHHRLDRLPGGVHRHVIRIDRSAGLRAVIQQVLGGIEDKPRFKAIRDALARARDNIPVETSAELLRTNLRLELEARHRELQEHKRSGASGVDSFELTMTGSTGLPALLNDPHLDSHFIGTQESEGVFRRLARHAMEMGVEAGAVDKETYFGQHQFEESAVPAELIQEADQVARPTRRALQLLRRDGERAKAVELLNSVLDRAKYQLLDLGGPSLVDVFLQLRQGLYEEDADSELILLVEDFAVLSGMQGPLLEVMVKEALPDGVRRYCNMRVAVALTEGYRLAETVLTRAGTTWFIREDEGTADARLDRVVDLVGAYLNAARVGRARLFRAWEASDGSYRTPTFEAEGDEKEQAQLAAFGVSRQGYPLFPFNRSAIAQLAPKADRGKGGVLFNPRLVIQNVLNRVLEQRQEFSSGSFPQFSDARSTLDADLRAEIYQALDRQHPGEGPERYQQLLHYWGDRSTRRPTVPESVFQAFRMPSLTAFVSGSAAHRPKQGMVSRPKESPIRQSTRQPVRPGNDWVQKLRIWTSESNLPQADAREIRRVISTAMWGYIHTDTLLVRVREKHRRADKVFLPRSGGGRGLEAEESFVALCTEEEWQDPRSNAEAVATVLAFMRHDEAKGAVYPELTEDLARIGAFLGSRREQAENWLRRTLAADEGDPEALATAMPLTNDVLGIGNVAAAAWPDRVEALLREGPERGTPGEEDWEKLRHLAVSHRSAWRERLYEQIAARQGGGAKVHAIDLPPLMKGISSWNQDSSEDYAAAMKAAEHFKVLARETTQLVRNLPKAVEARRQSLERSISLLREHFGEQPSKDELIRSVLDAHRLLEEHGRLGRSTVDALLKVRGLRDLRLAEAMGTVQSLTEEASARRLARVLAQMDLPVLDQAARVAEALDQALAACESAVERELVSAGTVESKAVDGFLTEFERLHSLLVDYEAIAS